MASPETATRPRIAYRIDTLADEIGVHRDTILVAIRKGELEAKRPSKRLTLIPAESVAAWLDAMPDWEPGLN